jgi:peptidoglycan/xylan/chitin deacetylase (PgdA/CDA1 family)
MMDEQFFQNIDHPVAGPPRELVGYGMHPPRFTWPGGKRVAVQIVVNYEEGSEKSFPMGDGRNDGYHELPYELAGQRDMSVESVYEYGSRAGIWRLFRIFETRGVPVTIVGTAVALERNPQVADAIRSLGYEVASHGYRWSNAFEMTRDEEREAIQRAVLSIEKSVGTRPVGWYSREMSVNTRELLVEEGGFLYDSECYNDDIPYWTRIGGKAHLVVPYDLVVNDCRFVLTQGYGSPVQFFEYAKATLDRLLHDGDDTSRMMSLGLHARFSGRPGRADAVDRFIDYALAQDGVWVARREDIAASFADQVKPGP